MSDRAGEPAGDGRPDAEVARPGRALLWVAIGVGIALLVAAVLTPSGAYEIGTILPLLGLIVLGTAITVLAGARGRRNEADRRLLAQLEAQDRAPDHSATGDPTDDRTA